ncbi:RNA polymerase sigma factor [Aquipuribacter sp. SD81]|uniref:RNA polymerase sigma factor n=1 Tax=Aquipuribacter sp. SD81 TaxID=3127703 RepID=UPI003018A9C2
MTTDRERFEELFERCYGPLLAYAIRRAGSAEDAADVVADTFTVAWRRIDDVPPGDRARLWLYGTARRVLSTHRRGSARREALDERLLADARVNYAAARHPHASGPEDRVLAALGSLSEPDQELLRLSVWEELDAASVARVLGVSTAAVHVRLHRARRRLRGHLGSVPSAPAATPRRSEEPAPFARTTHAEDA